MIYPLTITQETAYEIIFAVFVLLLTAFVLYANLWDRPTGMTKKEAEEYDHVDQW